MKIEKTLTVLLLPLLFAAFLCSCSGDEEKLTSEQYLQKGLDKYVERNYIEAIRFYDKSIELNQNNSVAFHQRGLAKGLLNDFGGALSDLNRAIELDPNYAQAYSNRGSVKIRMGKPDEGCEDYHIAIRLGYDDANLEIQKYCK